MQLQKSGQLRIIPLAQNSSRLKTAPLLKISNSLKKNRVSRIPTTPNQKLPHGFRLQPKKKPTQQHNQLLIL